MAISRQKSLIVSAGISLLFFILSMYPVLQITMGYIGGYALAGLGLLTGVDAHGLWVPVNVFLLFIGVYFYYKSTHIPRRVAAGLFTAFVTNLISLMIFEERFIDTGVYEYQFVAQTMVIAFILFTVDTVWLLRHQSR